MKIDRNRWWCAWLCVGAAVMGALGCSRGDLPELGKVSGTVTLDGQPLSGAIVMFQPASGRPAFGNTDESGNYDVSFTGDVKGAVVGKSSVHIFWPDGEPGSKPIPAKYNAKSEITKDVAGGSNTFDFALESK